MTTAVRIGLLGMGNVGGALVELLHEQRGDIARLTDLDLTVTRIAVRDVSRNRGDLHGAELTADVDAVVLADDVDLVVELVGGVDLARAWVRSALAAGKPVVTGNKALLAAHGRELFDLAAANGVELLFEASVAGGIPLMRALQKSLRGEPIRRIMGIVNGTTNYMLSKMTEDGADYGEVLAEAQALGYAEADPTADVEGHDAQAKAAIIASIAFGASVTDDDVPVQGISAVTADDIANAARMGYIIKLLAVIERAGHEISARVHPTMVPLDHPLANVRGSFNAVFIEGGAVDELMLYGRGAGGRPTASAVLGDVIEAASGVAHGSVRQLPAMADARLRAPESATSAFSLDLAADDRPGVLAEIAGVFGANGVSIRSMEQHGVGAEARITFITHEATERDMAATLEKLGSLPSVNRVGAHYRVIGS
ncbi:MAG: homoserine dehydrogenase [Actinomycetota bacterium]